MLRNFLIAFKAFIMLIGLANKITICSFIYSINIQIQLNFSTAILLIKLLITNCNNLS